MDIMYPIGLGSKYGDAELKFSLRSVEKHLKGYDRVFIVGNCPRWLDRSRVVYIQMEDIPRKHESIYRKIVAAIDNGISPMFHFWNDDHFLLKDLNVYSLPNYYDNTCGYWAGKSNGKYKRSCEAVPSEWKYFDVHTPIVYNARVFLDAFAGIDWKNDPLIKSTYANYYGSSGMEINDIKINGTYTGPQIMAQIHGKMFFSIGPYSLYPAMRKVLESLYPNKSKYEL